MLRHAGRLGAGAEVAGGLVLIGIGIKILHDHGVF
jgi:putative Mn2+ efflux pump MntP